VSRAGFVVVLVLSFLVVVVRNQTNVPGVRVGVAVDQPVVGATVSELFTAYSVIALLIAAGMPVSWTKIQCVPGAALA
jgi:hypothetical protein